MNRISSHMEEINMIAKLADIKQSHYESMLLIDALLEVLEEKNIVTKEEVREKAEQLDQFRNLQAVIADKGHPKP